MINLIKNWYKNLIIKLSNKYTIEENILYKYEDYFVFFEKGTLNIIRNNLEFRLEIPNISIESLYEQYIEEMMDRESDLPESTPRDRKVMRMIQEATQEGKTEAEKLELLPYNSLEVILSLYEKEENFEGCVLVKKEMEKRKQQKNN